MSDSSPDQLGIGPAPVGQEGSPTGEGSNPGRRRFLKIGLGVAPVILTLRARPAWARNCDPASPAVLESLIANAGELSGCPDAG